MPRLHDIGVRQADINNNNDNMCIANGLMKTKGVKDSESIYDNTDAFKLNVHAKEFNLERSRTAPQSIMNNSRYE